MLFFPFMLFLVRIISIINNASHLAPVERDSLKIANTFISAPLPGSEIYSVKNLVKYRVRTNISVIFMDMAFVLDVQKVKKE